MQAPSFTPAGVITSREGVQMLNELKDEFGFLATFVRVLPPAPNREASSSRNDTKARENGPAGWGAIQSQEIAALQKESARR